MPPDSVFQRTDSKRHGFDQTDSKRLDYINLFVRIARIKTSFVVQYYSHNPFVYIYNFTDCSEATDSGLGYPKIIMRRSANRLLLRIFKITTKSIAGGGFVHSCYYMCIYQICIIMFISPHVCGGYIYILLYDITNIVAYDFKNV